MSFRRQLRSLRQDVGELLEAHREDDELPDYSSYATDPVGFLRDVLGAEPWRAQREIARAVTEHPLVTVRSCHAAGKDWLAARLALWWCYAVRGLVVLTGPTAAQVEEILMRGELREAFRGSGLPGDLHVKALRPGGEGRAGILAKTATGVSSLTGFHDVRVLFVITEAQDPEIEHAWDAAFSVATGAEDRALTLGNPTHPSGRYYQAHQDDSDWHAVKIAASDIPNVAEGQTVVPGLMSTEGVERFKSEYGADSPMVTSRVHAEFRTTATDGLFARCWLEATAVRWEEGARGQEDPIVAVDPARFGTDATVLAVRRGARVEKLVTWSQADTMQTAERIAAQLAELGVQPANRDGLRWLRSRGAPKHKLDEYEGTGQVVVDTIGLGAGVADRLEERGFEVTGFKGSRSPRDGERFENLRAEGYWRLRDRLEAGEIALPPDEELFRELLAIRWEPTADGRVKIESKSKLRGRLGGSPDKADAVAMAVWPQAKGRPGKVRVVHR